MTSAQAVSTPAGLLTDPGTAMVWLMMHHQPVPTSPPAELRDVVAPVLDHHGQLIDWRFRPPSDGSHPDLANIFERVHQWREQWLTERAVSDAATLRTVLSWGDHTVGVSALRVLGVPDARLEPETVPLACMQAKKLRSAMAGRFGVALVDMESGRVARAFAPVEVPTVLLSSTHSGLTLNGDHVELPDGEVVRSWSTSEIETGSGARPIAPAELDLVRRVTPGHERVMRLAGRVDPPLRPAAGEPGRSDRARQRRAPLALRPPRTDLSRRLSAPRRCPRPGSGARSPFGHSGAIEIGRDSTEVERPAGARGSGTGRCPGPRPRHPRRA